MIKIPRQRPTQSYVPKPPRQAISRLRRYELEEEFKEADKKTYLEGEKIIMSKFNGVKQMIKESLQKHFQTEEELQQFLRDNPQYVINQRFGHGTKMINVELYDRGYAYTKQNAVGYRVPDRWLTEEEVTEYLKESAK